MSQPNGNAELQEFVAEKQLEWLTERGMTFADLLCDDDGVEYVMEEPTLMDEGENESGAYKRVDLPDFTQELN